MRCPLTISGGYKGTMSNEGNKIIYTMMRVSKFYDKKPVIKDISLSYFYGAKIGELSPADTGGC
jgi:sulfate-transporting ATPase